MWATFAKRNAAAVTASARLTPNVLRPASSKRVLPEVHIDNEQGSKKLKTKDLTTLTSKTQTTFHTSDWAQAPLFRREVKAGTTKTCCKSCLASTIFSQTDVMLMRLHLIYRSKADQREFLQARRCDPEEQVEDEDESGEVVVQTKKKDATYWLEMPEVLTERLNYSARLSHTRGVTPPLIRSKRPAEKSASFEVCRNFLMFIAGSKTQADFARKTSLVKGEHVNGRLSKSRVAIWSFFKNCVSRYEILPNSPYVILPFRSRKEVHAVFVLESLKMEAAAQKIKDAALKRNEAADLLEPEEEPHAETYIFDMEQCDEMRTTDKDFRYGNNLLGLRKDHGPEDRTISSLKYFNKVWQGDLRNKDMDAQDKISNVKIRKELPFSKCTFCKTIRAEQLKERDPNKKTKLAAQHRLHVQEVMAERETYYHHRLLARQEPHLYASITIDAADQSQFHLPHFAEGDKEEAGAYKVKTHVVGALMHGHPPLCFISGNACKQGNNVTIQALYECLLKLEERPGGIPPTVFVQLDNTSKQNKSQFFFGFCELLVHYGTVTKFVISFLPVGHTHEDIDQFFSRIAEYLRKHDALSLQHLQDLIPRTYKTQECHRPEVKIWDRLANISGYMKNNAVNQCTSRPGIMQFRSIEIVMGPHKRPIVRGRTNMSTRFVNDSYRGLETSSKSYPEAYSSFFSSKKPMPSLLDAARHGLIPDSQRHESDVVRLNNCVAGLEKMDKYSTSIYPEKHRSSNYALLQLELNPDLGGHEMPFDWNIADMEKLFRQRLQVQKPDPLVSDDPMYSPPNLSEFTIGGYYLIEPTQTAGTPTSHNTYLDNFPFYIGRILGAAPDTDGVPCYWVQTLVPADNNNGEEFDTLKQFVDATYQSYGMDKCAPDAYDSVPTHAFGQILKLTGTQGRGGGKSKGKVKTKFNIVALGDEGKRAAFHWGVFWGKGRNVRKDFGDYE
jgi:hypothetical protein